jgi:hypothetical protein
MRRHDRPAIDDPCELRAANGKRIANFSGPSASEFQFWRAGGRIVLAQLFPDGSYEVKP